MASLNHILRLNAASCLGFGTVFLVGPGPVSAMLGTIPPQVLIAIGAGLMANGVHLGIAGTRAAPRRAEILW